MAQVSRTAHQDGHHHIVPVKTLVAVFLALVLLTILTYLASLVDLGHLNIPIALAIAAVKALLVVTFFMALKYDSPINRLVFVMGLLFVGIFLGFTLVDIHFRGDAGNVAVETIRDTEMHDKAIRAAHPEGAGAAATPPGEQAAAGADSTSADSTGAHPSE